VTSGHHSLPIGLTGVDCFSMLGVSLLVFEKLAIPWFADADAYAIGVPVLPSSAAIAVTIAARRARQCDWTAAWPLRQPPALLPLRPGQGRPAHPEVLREAEPNHLAAPASRWADPAPATHRRLALS
jgi:hypothetical protein